MNGNNFKKHFLNYSIIDQREDFLSWSCSPTPAPTNAPTFEPCSAELSILCYINSDGNRECLSECTEDSCVDWKNSYNDIKNNWKSGTYNVSSGSSVISSIPITELKDYVTLLNIKRRNVDIPDINCWATCQATPKCLAYNIEKDQDNEDICKLYDNIRLDGFNFFAPTVYWACSKEMSNTGRCNFNKVIEKPSKIIDNFSFQPSIGCDTFECEGNKELVDIL